MILSLFGGVAGLAPAYWGLPPLLRMAPSSVDAATAVVLDVRVLLFSLALIVLTGAFFGIVPALQLSHVHVSSALASGSKGAVSGAGRERVRATCASRSRSTMSFQVQPAPRITNAPTKNRKTCHGLG